MIKYEKKNTEVIQRFQKEDKRIKLEYLRKEKKKINNNKNKKKKK